MNQAIDTLRIFTRLKGKFNEEQAQVVTETLSEIIDNNMASKQDLQEFEIRLKADLTAEIQKSKADTVKWVAALMIAQSGVIAALVKLL